MASLSAAGGSVAGSSLSRAQNHPNSTRDALKAFVPTLVEVKGWVKNWSSPDDSSLMEDEVFELLNTITADLKENLKNLIDVDKTKEMAGPRLLFTKMQICLKEGCTKANAIDLQRDVARVLTKRKITKNGQTLRCTAETAPALQPLSRAAGKFYGLLESKGVSKDHVRMQYLGAAQELRIRWWTQGTRPVRLATYTVHEGWALQPETWRTAFPDLSIEEGVKRLSA